MPLNVLIGAGLALAGTVLFFVWLPFARHRLHRAQMPGPAGPSTMELRDDPPAVVNLLLHELELTGDAVAATLLDLAARDHLEIVELSLEENLVIPHRRSDDPLSVFEQHVLAVVETAALGQPHATIPGIAAGLDPESAQTWFGFRAAVEADARRRGLVGPARTESKAGTAFVFAAFPAVGLFVAVPQLWIVTPFVWVPLGVVGIILLLHGRTTVLTDEGRRVAAHWLGVRRFIAEHGNFDDLPPAAVEVWDRYLAYGAAMDLSDDAVKGLIHELRTTISVRDVRAVAGAIRQARQLHRDPKAQLEWRRTALTAIFGPDNPHDAIFGAETADFWMLLENTGRGWSIAMMTRAVDPTLFRTACNARISALVAAAPAELAADVNVVSGAARAAVEAIASKGAAGWQALATDPRVAAPAVSDAADRLVVAVAARLGVRPTANEVFERLAGPSGTTFTTPWGGQPT
ncbi:MAG: hypothetical protein QOI95_4290 [Acidimicrobiaceae bacterium]|jgi:hypothetical protein